MAETITREMIEVVAAAIANARGSRHGAPEVENILRVLPQKLKDEVLEDAEAALKAILRLHQPVAPPPAAEAFAMDLYSPHGVAGFGQTLQTASLILHLECVEPPFINVTTYTREHTQKLGAAIEATALRASTASVEQDTQRLACLLVNEIDGLISESEGVAGLHQNGDMAPWGELVPGGEYERLTSLDDLRNALAQGEVARG